MRSIPFLVIALGGCVSAVQAPRGGTMREMAGGVSLVFTNASPEAMCELSLAPDDRDDYGDNWLPAGGLPSGKSADFKVKPGRYKAMWTTCRAPNKPYYAGTLWRETSVEVTDATQLFAYVASNISPTSRAAPRDFHKLVRFTGQAIDPNPQPAQPQIAAVAPPRPVIDIMPGIAFRLPEVKVEPPPPPPPPPVAKLDPKELAQWIDPRAVAEVRARAAKLPRVNVAAKGAAPTLMPMRPSAARGHDVGSQAVGYKLR
ncbi:MAG: hypothetical protein KIT31_25150 [Deltaproteobacteria bacterium]|nr:hypothetical protein [Deltaproteobacteria bacterium]